MMKNNIDYKSRFRILKGRGISLVVFALLLGSTLVIPANALTIGGAETTVQQADTTAQDIEITSSGSITIADTNTSAVTSTAGISSGRFVSNSGAIIATNANGHSNGIHIVGDNNGTITNDGTINLQSSLGADGGNVTPGSSAFFLENNEGNITLTSNSDIDISTVNDYAYGIYMAGDNNGTIKVDGTIDLISTQASAHAVYIVGDMSGTIENLATINITSPNSSSTGIFVKGDLKSIGEIINRGNITARTYGIVVDTGQKNEGNITNTGTITAYYGVVAFEHDGIITNTGTITGAGNSIWTNAGTGTVTNDTGGVLNGKLTLKSTGLVTNRGTINLNNAASTIVGDFTQTAIGTLGIDADITGANTATNSKLTVGGAATLEDGTNIRVDVTGASANQTAFLTAGSSLANVISAGTLTVDVTKLNITDNSALLNFNATLDGNTLDLKAVEGQTIEEAVDENPQSGGAAKVLGDIPDGEDADIDTFKTYLNTLPTNEAVAKEVAKTTPTVTIATSTVGAQLVNTMSSVVQARQASVRGFGAGDIAFSDKNVWIKPFGGYTKQDNVDGITGFEANTFGLGFGVDGEYKAGSRAGLAFFYTNADVDTNDIDQNSDLGVFNLIAYGSNPIVDDKTNLFYQVGYGYHMTDTSRVVPAVGTAKADFVAQSIFLQLKATREIEINNIFKVKPAIVTSYTYYKNPSYTESGAGGMNLHVEGFNSSAFVLGVQSDFDYEIDKDTKLLSNISLSYDFNNDAQSVNSSYTGAGPVFSTKSIENDALIYKAGVGLAKRLRQDLYFDLKYDLDGRGSDFLNHVVSAKFNYKF